MDKGDRAPQEAEGKKMSQQKSLIAEDVNTLHSFGYAQELLRRMSGFSNFAVSFSIICILSGGIAGDGMRVNSVSPGWIDNPFNDPICEMTGVDEVSLGDASALCRHG